MAFETGFDQLRWPWQKTTTRNFSKKVKQNAEAYLNKKGIKLEQLTEQQQFCVLKYIKRKRCIKFSLPFFVLLGLINICLLFYAVPIFEEITTELAPHSKVILSENITKELIEKKLGENDKVIITYGQMCAIVWSIVVIMTFSFISLFVSTIGMFFQSRDTREFLNAFLGPDKKEPATDLRILSQDYKK